MINIPEYTITEKVNEGQNFVVYRAYSVSDLDKKTCLLKVLKEVDWSPTDIGWLKLEYNILKGIRSKGIENVYGIQEINGRIVIILEDFHGVTLKVFQDNKPIPVRTFLNMTIQLAGTLGEIHKHGIIHRYIRPKSILVNKEEMTVKLFNFGILSRITNEKESIYDEGVLNNRLPYISPEQTGRMNRSMDYRTDFYSLGITFYEMLTGVPPFRSTDPLELIHCHIARQAIALYDLNDRIPIAVSKVINKLISKNAEDRYKSGYGLKTDLEECLNQLQKRGKVEVFIPGKNDRSNELNISQKLYGRAKEIKALMMAFDRVSHGTCEMILVSGYSGVGKSALVHEINKPLIKKRGYFISGKCEQFCKDRPFSAVIQAFQGLIRQFLTESEERIQEWREELLKALGSNGQVIVDVIQEVGMIIGRQPSVQQLGPKESENRFNMVFQSFFGVFTTKEHPLVLFLDDLQWVDTASLNLIKTS